jgi:large subunit ribosomal protein L9
MGKKQVQVILTKDVENVGINGQIQTVSLGFAKNYLLPNAFATLGTKQSIAAALKKQDKIKERESQEAQAALALKVKLEEKPISMSVKASKDETLYGSVTKQDIIDQIAKTIDVVVEKKNVFLPQSIKKAGEYPVTIKLHKNAKAKARLVIIAEISETDED